MNEVSDYELKKVSLDEKNIAFVIVPTNDGKNGKVGVYLPKLMTEIDMGDKAWVKPKVISSIMIKNDNFKISFDPVVKHRNYYDVEPLRISNIEAPALKEGETVWVNFLDNDLKKGTYESQFVDESKRTTDRHRVFVVSKESPDASGGEYEFVMDSAKQLIRIAMEGGRGEGNYSIEIDGKRGIILNGSGSEVIVGGGDVIINGTSFNGLVQKVENHESRIVSLEAKAHTH